MTFKLLLDAVLSAALVAVLPNARVLWFGWLLAGRLIRQRGLCHVRNILKTQAGCSQMLGLTETASKLALRVAAVVSKHALAHARIALQTSFMVLPGAGADRDRQQAGAAAGGGAGCQRRGVAQHCGPPRRRRRRLCRPLGWCRSRRQR